MSTVSWILLTYNRSEIVEKSLNHNMANAGSKWDEFVHVDNGSSDDVAAMVKSLVDPDTQVLNKVNRGVAIGYNIGMGLATKDYIVITGCDMLLPDNWLATFKRYMEIQDGIACMYSKTVDQCPERIRGAPAFVQDMPLIPSLALERRIFRRDLLKDIGYFPESFGHYAYDDLAWAMRAEKVCKESGLLAYVIPNMIAEHMGTEGITTYDGKDSKEYHEFKKREVQNPAKREELARLRDLGWPRFSPFI